VATNYTDLIPIDVARDVIAAAESESVALALGNRIVMPSGTEKVPILSVMPTAKFVTPTYGGRKPLSQVEWTSEQLEAEEIALTCYIPDAFLDDAGYPVWESVRSAVGQAIANALDAAVLYGTSAPASYPAGGIAALAGAAQSGTDALDAIDKAAEVIETSGLLPNGIAAGSRIGSALRAA
jgi:HK97 family phage major capsid protein